jgi:hypothetical protein
MFVSDLVGVRGAVAVLGADAGLFWVMGGGQVSLRPETWHE